MRGTGECRLMSNGCLWVTAWPTCFESWQKQSHAGAIQYSSQSVSRWCLMGNQQVEGSRCGKQDSGSEIILHFLLFYDAPFFLLPSPVFFSACYFNLSISFSLTSLFITCIHSSLFCLLEDSCFFMSLILGAGCTAFNAFSVSIDVQRDLQYRETSGTISLQTRCQTGRM